MFNRIKAASKALVISVFVLAFSLAFPALAMAQGDVSEGLGIIQRILGAIPDWYQVLAAFGYAFALLAAATPTVRDDQWSSGYKKFLARVRKIIDMLGLSVGNANRQGKQ